MANGVCSTEKVDFVLSMGAEDGNAFLGLLGHSLCAAVLGPFVRSKTITLVAVETPEDLAMMRDLLASGAITVPLERTFPLAMVADAIRHLEAGRAMGNVVVP